MEKYHYRRTPQAIQACNEAEGKTIALFHVLRLGNGVGPLERPADRTQEM